MYRCDTRIATISCAISSKNNPIRRICTIKRARFVWRGGFTISICGTVKLGRGDSKLVKMFDPSPIYIRIRATQKSSMILMSPRREHIFVHAFDGLYGITP